MIEIYLLQQLDAFARNGTLSKAAEELHISQPALTKSMRRLEEEFGVPLFTRTARKISLNDCGRTAAAYAHIILEQEETMTQSVIAQDRRQRTITAGSCVITASSRLMPILQQSFPEKTIITEITDDTTLIARLKNHSYQVAILSSIPQDSSIYCQQFITEHIYISVPKNHSLAKKKALYSKDLNGLSILIFNMPFWIERFHGNLSDSLLMAQSDADVMDELVESPNLLVFNSDVMLKEGYVPEDRISIPVEEPYAVSTYYVACLNSEKRRFGNLFSAVRAEALR